MSQDLYMEYDDIIIGKRSSFSNRFFNKDRKYSMNNALTIMRYAFSRYLGWSSDAVEANIDGEILEKMHLSPLMNYIEYPVEYDKETDYFYLVSLLYRDKKMGLKEKTIHTYENILSGDLSKYPKDYFLGSDGIVKAAICLQYVISQEVLWSDTNDLYNLFASDRGYELLKKYKLLNASKESFDCPVDFIHFALPDHQKDDFYLNYYKFKFFRELINERGRKKRANSDFKLEV